MSSPVNLDENNKSRRPKDTKFKQQKLPAWQPIMTAGTVLPAFFAIGIAFIPLGVALLVTSNSVQEVSVDYTRDCQTVITTGNEPWANYSYCSEYLEANEYTGVSCTCRTNFTLDSDFKGQVYMYYGLSNFYQNHRRYVKSRDDNQLRGGSVSSPNDLSSDCDPYKGNGTLAYAPCGAIANSLFNDSLSILLVESDSGVKNIAPTLLGTNIAWNTDKDVKFKNPSSFSGTMHPPNWQIDVENLGNGTNSGYENEDLIVWMRTAALPSFRKLYRRVEHTGTYFGEGLPKGTYTLTVTYNYPVTAFDGSKRMILTTTSWMGGKNPFLGIAYLVVGSICIVLGIVFLIIHIQIGKKPVDMIQNVNSRTEY